jgi:hypothetical protein
MTNGARSAIATLSTASSPATARAAGLRETTRATRQATLTAAAIAVITHQGQPMSTVSATAIGQWYVALEAAFNGAATRLVEQSENEQGVVLTYSVKVSSYIHPSTGMGIALKGQPVTQWYFHRPISELFRVWFRHGFLLDGIEEPVLAQEDVRPGSTAGVFVAVPPILAARMRLPG